MNTYWEKKRIGKKIFAYLMTIAMILLTLIPVSAMADMGSNMEKTSMVGGGTSLLA